MVSHADNIYTRFSIINRVHVHIIANSIWIILY